MKDGRLRRRAGVLLPLSSLRHQADLGIGDFSGLPSLFDWMRESGLSVWLSLPMGDLHPQSGCPYSAISAFAFDPAYIALGWIPEPRALPPVVRLLESREARRFKGARRVRFGKVRRMKLALLEEEFRASERQIEEHPAFGAFREENRAWLEDYALFKALKEADGWRSWKRWPEELRRREPDALGRAREEHRGRVLFHMWVQWLARSQWETVREEAARRGILLFGDVPFGLDAESADVWARQDEYDLSLAMGAPPDQYSATGQAWGLPAYRWDLMEQRGHTWWRARMRQAGRLFDFVRLDHAVGFFRTWVIRADRDGRFDIQGEDAQRGRGARFFRMALEETAPSLPVAEDLGVIPPFVRETLRDLGIPGCRITRWELDGSVYRHPRSFPELSIAATGNHDTSTLTDWWGELNLDQRAAYWSMASGGREGVPLMSASVHEALLRSLYEAGSFLTVPPLQDLFGGRDRINVPGTVSSRNWSYRMRMDVEDLASAVKTGRKTRMLRRLAIETDREIVLS